MIEGKNRVGPVQIGGTEKLKAVADTALRVGAQIQLLAAFHRPALEGPVHLILQKLDRHLGSHDLDLGVEVDQMADQAGMVRFGVGDDQVIDRQGIDLLLQQRQPAALELEMAGVDQGRALTPHQEGVVGGAVAQAELDVEAAAIPVERADRGGVGADGLALKREARRRRCCGAAGRSARSHGSPQVEVDFRESLRKPGDCGEGGSGTGRGGSALDPGSAQLSGRPAVQIGLAEPRATPQQVPRIPVRRLFFASMGERGRLAASIRVGMARHPGCHRSGAIEVPSRLPAHGALTARDLAPPWIKVMASVRPTRTLSWWVVEA